MLSFLPPFVKGPLAFLLLVINTLFWCVFLFAFALIKLVLPFGGVRRQIDRALNAIATAWISCNSAWMRLTQATAWDVQGVAELRYQGWYLVNCNHQSWAAIGAASPVAGSTQAPSARAAATKSHPVTCM